MCGGACLPVGHIYVCVTAVREEPLMAAVLCRTTLPGRTDPLEAAAPQMMAPWAEVLALLPHLEALAEAGAAFQLVETPGQVACVVADAPAAPVKARAAPASCGCQGLSRTRGKAERACVLRGQTRRPLRWHTAQPQRPDRTEGMDGRM